jgi:N6-adenosine-specific RNA methylase IME4
MIDPIVQEVRDIRASIAEQFGFDRKRILAWARAQTAARKAALGKKPKAKQPQETAGGTRKSSPVTRKRRVRPARVSA